MLRVFIYTAFTVAACVGTTAFFISGGALRADELAAIRTHLGKAYVHALAQAELAARDARAEYCQANAETCAPPNGY